MDAEKRFEPYGGEWIPVMVHEDRKKILQEMGLSLRDITLNDRQLCDLELVATGALSPLRGFLNRTDYESVLDRMRLQNDLIWPIPICLDVPETQARHLEAGQSVCLRDAEGFLLAILHIEDIWPVEREKEALGIFGTLDRTHPGVRYLFDSGGDYYLGGTLEVLHLPLHFDFRQLRLNPEEIRRTYSKLGWHRVVGFQTRNPIHKAQFEMTLMAMKETKANLLLLPIVGMTKPDDFDHFTRARCYQAVARHYPPDSFVLNFLPLATRMAGPREAVWHCIIAKNYGCTHFIVGRDHASPGLDRKKRAFYSRDEACKTVEKMSVEIGITSILFDEIVYLPFEDEFRPLDRVPKNTQTIAMSGTHIRDRVRMGKRIPEWATFPEVIDELRRSYPPPRKQGFTVFLTGLSGAGKSTIARVLYSRFLEIGDRPVTLLDGDIVRRNLSSELGFSKEHRDLNVKRIGFVASEITKNRGIALCAPIAPYESTREEIRALISNHGGFIEVHVATPIEECEKRDRKGMYAKARAGLITGFTGVDDPYEDPENPEVRIDTTQLSPDEAAQEVLLFLGQKGYI